MNSAPDYTRQTVDRLHLEQVKTHLANRQAGQNSTTKQQTNWNRFYDSCSSKIRRFAFSCGIPQDKFEDCLQEVWCELLARLPTFQFDERRGQFDTWLFQIVKSKVTDSHRLQKRGHASVGSELLELVPDSYFNPLIHNDEQEILSQAFVQLRQNLTELNYQVLYQRLIEQKSVETVAKNLDLTNEQVWYRFHRAKQQLEQVTSSLTNGNSHPKKTNLSEKSQKKAKNAQGSSVSSVSRINQHWSPIGQGGSLMDFVFKRLELGRQPFNPEWKIEWSCEPPPTPQLFIRKLSLVACAEICGPEESINTHWLPIANAAMSAGVAAGIATIIATPTAALPIFQAEFSRQLSGKVGRDVGEEICVALSVKQEANGPWCRCTNA